MTVRALARAVSVVAVAALSAAVLPVTVAVAAPVGQIVAPASGATVGGVVTISVNADEDPSCGSGYVHVDFGLDGESFNQAATTPEANGRYEMGWDTTLHRSGSHTLTITLSDACLNQRLLSQPVTIDNGAPPTVTITAPGAGDTVTGTVTVTADVTPGTAPTISQVDFYNGTSLIETDYYAPYSISWGTAELADGPHQLHANAIDSNNQVGTSASRQVTVTNPHPTVTITEPATSEWALHDTVQITATASGSSPIDYINFFVDDHYLHTIWDAPYTYAWDTTYEWDGPHTLSAVAATENGEFGTSPAISITIDNINPFATLRSPAAGSTVSGSAVLLSASSNQPQSCPTPQPRVEFLLDGISQGVQTSPAASGDYETRVDTTMLANGPHELKVRASCDDGYSWGPFSPVRSIAFTNVEPGLAFSAPTANQGISGVTPYQVSVIPHDGATISSVEFLVDGTVIGTDPTAPYAVTLDTRARALGAHTLTARAHDSNDQVGQRTETVYVVAPTTLSLAVPVRTLTYGTAQIVTATLRASQPYPGGVLANRNVSLLRRQRGTTAWAVAGTVATNSSGVASFRVAPDRNTDYTARFAGVARSHAAASSALVVISVKPRVTLASSSTSVTLGRSFTLTTAVGPNRTGQVVYVQRWNGSSWANLSGKRLDSYSKATWTFRPSARGATTYRVYRPADSTHLIGVSASLTVQIT